MVKKLLLSLLVLFVAVIALLAIGYFWMKSQLSTVESTDSFEAAYFSQAPVRPGYAEVQREPCIDNNPQRNAYFGELHIHTSVSHDSGSFGNLTLPGDAYRFAQGDPITLRLKGDDSGLKDIPVVSLRRPLDFAAVTDHAENFGETQLCLTRGSPAYDTFVCKVNRGDIRLPVSDIMQPLMRMLALVIFQSERSEQICGVDGHRCIEAAIGVWDEQQRAAEEAYDRSEDCRFTSFVAYEYSLAAEQANLHRNIIFANSTVPPVPLSSKDQPVPEKLWQWLKTQCIDSATDCDVISIPHNGNWSSGRMFYPYTLTDLSSEEQRDVARLRQEVEPLFEIMQVKGDSECRNGFSGVVGGYDELCDFEKLRHPDEVFEDCGDQIGRGGMSLSGCLSKYSYARTALTQGLKEQQQLGVNPFEFGIIAATDNHTAAAGAVNERRFLGSTGIDRDAKHRLGGPRIVPGVAKGDTTRYNPGGLAGVWAEENTRESLFSSMKRKETFGTSGPRILPRFFAGWDYDESLCTSKRMLKKAYANGVPMGGRLQADSQASNPAKQVSRVPTFLVSALKDNVADAAKLQKLQIIKGWVGDNGQLHQQVVDVAGTPEAMGTLNTDSCEPMTSGFNQLCTVWRDEDFDPDIDAVYYARAIENPSCRWSTYDCNTFAEAQRPAACANLPESIQERAWTSPIWYKAGVNMTSDEKY